MRLLVVEDEKGIADEPTGNLDKETETEILKIFSDLAYKENKRVIIVTHSENVCNKCDGVYELVPTKEKDQKEVKKKVKAKKKND